MNESIKDWEAKYYKRKEICQRWGMPVFLSWLSILVGWYFLVYHFCPATFNPHRFNPKIHQIITPDGDLIDDASTIADENGNVWVDKWRDPRTKEIYTPTHRDVIRGERSEKIARAIITFFCGLPLLGLYRLRARECGDNYFEIRQITRTGLLICLVCGAVSYFIPIVELVLALAGSSRYSE